MLTIVVPMAGRGSRFADAGYSLPKPLIPILGMPMIRLVIGNIRPSMAHKFVFIVQSSIAQAYGLRELLPSWAPGSVLIEIDGITEGAACTVLAARSEIAAETPLMIANSDQYISIDIDHYLSAAAAPEHDGFIMTMKAHDPKWSFVGIGPSGFVDRVVEKRVISDQATVGIYNFSRGGDFISAADAMIAAERRVNGEFYVAPVYNELIARGARIGTYDIGTEAGGMYGLGTPADLELFLSLPIAKHAVGTLGC